MLETLFNKAGDGACGIDDNQRIVFWNASAEAMLGYTAEEAIGRLCWQLLAGRTGDGEPYCRPHCAPIEWAREARPAKSFQLFFRHRDGHDIPVDISTIVVDEGLDKARGTALVQLSRSVELPTMATESLRVQMLGPLRVWRENGQPVVGDLWRRIKARALFAFLAIQHGQRLGREALLELLWPDLPYHSGLRNLNTTVYNVRRSLEPGLKSGGDSRYILYEGGHYLLNDRIDLWLDSEVMEQTIKRARMTDDIHKAIELYQAGIALYRGDYLSDLVDTAVWSAAEQHRWRQLYLTTLEALAGLFEQQRRLDDAAMHYHKVLAVDPCRESAARHLIRLELGRGRPSAAVDVCYRLRVALWEDMGIEEPSANTQLACQEALSF